MQKPNILGILNLTPDSFSDGGVYFNYEDAIKHIRKLTSFSKIIDIGGESTRPGAERISPQEEVARIKDVVLYLEEKKIEFSIDTVNFVTAKFATEHGCRIINDISGCKIDHKIVKNLLVKDKKIKIILNHWRDFSKDMYRTANYDRDVICNVKQELKNQINFLIQSGVERENIILDAGIGFNKKYEANVAILKNFQKLQSLNLPFLIAISRKRFIKNLFNLPQDCDNQILDIASSMITKEIMNRYGDMVWGIRTHSPYLLNQVFLGKIEESFFKKEIIKFFDKQL